MGQKSMDERFRYVDVKKKTHTMLIFFFEFGNFTFETTLVHSFYTRTRVIRVR